MTRITSALVVAAVVCGVVTAAGPTAAAGEEASPTTAPRPEWEVFFAEDISIEEYSRQLDYFKIEVAAVKDNKIEYISKLSGRKPEKRLGRREEDERLYIGWKSGALEAVDRKLLAKARVNPQGKDILHYFPPDVQAAMEEAQRKYADRKPSQIKRTRFEIHPRAAGGYEFVVVEQQGHRPPSAGARARLLLNPPAED
jgi:hypothetical protein